MIPQTVTNNGDKYIGEAAAYNDDLRKAQMGSYGFKIIIIGLSISAGNCIVLLATCYCLHLQEKLEEPRIQPQSIQVPIERRVTISPTIIQIPEHITRIDKAKNLKKWIGNAVIPECII